jgi:hypothetical protein
VWKISYEPCYAGVRSQSGQGYFVSIGHQIVSGPPPDCPPGPEQNFPLRMWMDRRSFPLHEQLSSSSPVRGLARPEVELLADTLSLGDEIILDGACLFSRLWAIAQRTLLEFFPASRGLSQRRHITPYWAWHSILETPLALAIPRTVMPSAVFHGPSASTSPWSPSPVESL